VNGQPRDPALAAMRDTAGKEVTTVEGLEKNDCIRFRRPGCKSTAAVRLLPGGTDHAGGGFIEQQKEATDHEIDEAMSGNICRCGTYQRIRAAIKQRRGKWHERD